MTKQQIIAEARSWIGTPYQHQGRSRTLGVDCIGLVEGVVDAFGIPFEDRLYYNSYGAGLVNLADELSKWLIPVSYQLARPGDVLCMWLRRPGELRHCGFLTPLGLLHTHSTVGHVTEHAIDESWRKRIGQAFRLPGVED